MMNIKNLYTIQSLARTSLYMSFVILGLAGCTPPNAEKSIASSKINTAHLDGLYEERNIGDKSFGTISIYAEFPDYHHVGDADEGVACVDDASRAAIFYIRQYKQTTAPEYLSRAKKLLRFLAYMQAPNGYFYNFIWKDGSINTDGQTSRAEPNWWSWRTLWAFGEALDVLDEKDPMVEELNQRRDVLVGNILREGGMQRTDTDTAGGLTIPLWLPGDGAASDQASIMLTGLALMYGQYEQAKSSVEKDSLLDLIQRMAEGIMMMQVKQPDSLYDGAFMSWENIWHAYGNIQAYALLTAGRIIGDTTMIQSALYEIDHFYPRSLAAGGLCNFDVRNVNGKVVAGDMQKLPQIAYGQRPMIWAAMKAYEITGTEKYKTLANDLSGWFDGHNFAGKPMYDMATGRGYDGIDQSLNINMNSGAESTIESLLALQALEFYTPNR